MGKVFCKLWKKENFRILMLGLDAAGKTTILYTLKLGEIVTTIPTIGFNVETIEEKKSGVELTVWDVGGRCKMRALYRHYYCNTDAIVYIIDSRDDERLDEAIEEFHSIIDEDMLRTCPVLLLCNKQDLDPVMTVDKVKEKLRPSYNQDIGIYPVIGLDRKTLAEPLQWLAERLGNKKFQKVTEATLNEAKDVIKPVLNPLSYIKTGWMKVWNCF